MDATNALQEACKDLGYDEPSDGEVAEMHETLDDFRDDYKKWNECSGFDEVEFAGLKAIQFWGVQTFKGRRRKDFTVIDCGDCRVVIS